MLWNLLARILIDLLVGLIVELAMSVIMALFFQDRRTHSVSLA
jgi:hypothetical protein